MPLWCQCVPNTEHTAILRPCLLHAQWAKAQATTNLQARVTEADGRPAPSAKGTR